VSLCGLKNKRFPRISSTKSAPSKKKKIQQKPKGLAKKTEFRAEGWMVVLLGLRWCAQVWLFRSQPETNKQTSTPSLSRDCVDVLILSADG
jgi:hypothetical protein